MDLEPVTPTDEGEGAPPPSTPPDEGAPPPSTPPEDPAKQPPPPTDLPQCPVTTTVPDPVYTSAVDSLRCQLDEGHDGDHQYPDHYPY